MMPTSMVTASRPIISSVVAAFFDLGFWNAGTPLLIASTPVSAAAPEENARSTRNAYATPAKVPSAVSVKPALSAFISVPVAAWNNPQTTMTRMPRMNPYVGIAKAFPDSRMPRRFNAVSTETITMDASTLCSATHGTADPMLATPDEVDTATVST